MLLKQLSTHGSFEPQQVHMNSSLKRTTELAQCMVLFTVDFVPIRRPYTKMSCDSQFNSYLLGGPRRHFQSSAHTDNFSVELINEDCRIIHYV